MRPTYHDIQRLTGLSLATISKYFNGLPVREKNRVAIEAAAAQLEFRVNEFARSLRTRRSRTIGVLLPELNNEFHTTIIAGIEESLRAYGYGTIVCSRGAEVDGARESVEFLMGKMVDGIIAIPVAGDGPALSEAMARGIPVVLVDRVVSGLATDAVIVDNRHSSAVAVQALLDAGHRDIAMICGHRSVYTMDERAEGFVDALAEAGLPFHEDHLITGDLSVASGAAAMQRLMAADRPPTAVFCANYELTLGAIISVNELDLRIPDDLSFIGFDSLELARAVRPRLAVVTQPVSEIVATAAELVFARVEGQTSPEFPALVTLPVTLSAGESVGPAPVPGR